MTSRNETELTLSARIAICAAEAAVVAFAVTVWVLLWVATPAHSEDRIPWKEPTAGPISPTGTVIDVENYHCVVKGPRSVECLNVGRVCLEKRARDEIHTSRTFGCALKDSPNHPCPLDDPAEQKRAVETGSCWPIMIGGW